MCLSDLFQQKSRKRYRIISTNNNVKRKRALLYNLSVQNDTIHNIRSLVLDCHGQGHDGQQCNTGVGGS